uniref:Uncharacterized protein n=1 Tax=Setaria viridis TaxID=4556 RepID=A0A4U6VHH4_SETVI|nr:hypothetical protein SEVIR_3G320500v2 [Setaria viridis]
MGEVIRMGKVTRAWGPWIGGEGQRWSSTATWCPCRSGGGSANGGRRVAWRGSGCTWEMVRRPMGGEGPAGVAGGAQWPFSASVQAKGRRPATRLCSLLFLSPLSLLSSHLFLAPPFIPFCPLLHDTFEHQHRLTPPLSSHKEQRQAGGARRAASCCRFRQCSSSNQHRTHELATSCAGSRPVQRHWGRAAGTVVRERGAGRRLARACSPLGRSLRAPRTALVWGWSLSRASTAQARRLAGSHGTDSGRSNNP